MEDTSSYNAVTYPYQFDEEANISTPIPPFATSFNQTNTNSEASSNNPLWGGNSALLKLNSGMYVQNEPPDACEQPTSSITYSEGNFGSNFFNPSALLANESLPVPSNNINSEFFDHPHEDFIIATADCVYPPYSYQPEAESTLPPSSSNSYFQMDEEIESSDSDEGPVLEGGYDYEFVRSKEIEDDDLMCPICKLVSREPQQSACCGKVFCGICIDKLKQTKTFVCPNCRKEPISLFADKRSSRSIFNLKVFCKRKRRGCQWCGTLQEAEKHPNNCRHQRVPCLNECGKRPQRRSMESHMKRFCPNRQFQCEDCKEFGQWAYITGEHVEQCPEKVVECVNEGCAYRTNRGNLEDHLLDCPKKLLHCSYSDVGCTATFIREDVTTHEIEHMPDHLDYAVKAARAFIAPHRDHLLQVAPAVIRIPNFSQSNEVRSHPFLTSIKGYKMCLLLNRKMKCIEFSFCLMPGLYDTSLLWPFNGKVTLALLNQKEDRHHHEMSITLTDAKSIPRVVSRYGDFGESVLVGKFRPSKHCDNSSTSPYDWQELESVGYVFNGIMSIRVSSEHLQRKAHPPVSGRKKAKFAGSKHH